MFVFKQIKLYDKRKDDCFCAYFEYVKCEKGFAIRVGAFRFVSSTFWQFLSIPYPIYLDSSQVE